MSTFATAAMPDSSMHCQYHCTCSKNFGLVFDGYPKPAHRAYERRYRPKTKKFVFDNSGLPQYPKMEWPSKAAAPKAPSLFFVGFGNLLPKPHKYEPLSNDLPKLATRNVDFNFGDLPAPKPYNLTAALAKAAAPFQCPHPGCPVRAPHRSGKYTALEKETPLEVGLVEDSFVCGKPLTFEDMKFVDSFHKAHQSEPVFPAPAKTVEPARPNFKIPGATNRGAKRVPAPLSMFRSSFSFAGPSSDFEVQEAPLSPKSHTPIEKTLEVLDMKIEAQIARLIDDRLNNIVAMMNSRE